MANVEAFITVRVDIDTQFLQELMDLFLSVNKLPTQKKRKETFGKGVEDLISKRAVVTNGR